jgi:hypothetical protein
MNMIEADKNLHNIIKGIYSYVLPCTILILLLGVSQLIDRPRFLGSSVFDLVVRLLLCLWFVFGYRRLTNISKYRPTSVSRWSKADLDFVEKLFYISLGILYGVLMTLITWWIIQVFLPIFVNISIFISILNGLICSIPAIANYYIFKP